MSDSLMRFTEISLTQEKRGGNEEDGDHVEELADESSVHQEMQDCSLLSSHQSPEMGFDMLSRPPLDP